LSQLIELQELDTEIQRVIDRLAKIPVEREQIESEFNQYAAEFLALKSKYELTLEERKQLEIELASTQHHHEKYKQDLMRVRNTKEYETALREIDATKKQIGVFETEILKHMEEIESLEAQLKVSTPDVERKRAEVDQALQSLDTEREQAEQQIVALGRSREQLASRVPRQLFATTIGWPGSGAGRRSRSCATAYAWPVE
jgi:predicted  nucleic acid-binding Zn-ribbon protein